MKKITTEAELRELIGFPSEVAEKKIYTRINKTMEEFIQLSPFVLLSTSIPQGQPSVSPKGDVPGFVKLQGANTLLIPERPGNRLAFSLSNMLHNPHLECLFLIPGTPETLRVGGTVELIHDAELCHQMNSRDKDALLVIQLTVTQAYFHCAKAFLRSDLWEISSWPEKMKISFGKQIADNVGEDDAFVKEFDEMVEDRYRTTL